MYVATINKDSALPIIINTNYNHNYEFTCGGHTFEYDFDNGSIKAKSPVIRNNETDEEDAEAEKKDEEDIVYVWGKISNDVMNWLIDHDHYNHDYDDYVFSEEPWGDLDLWEDSIILIFDPTFMLNGEVLNFIEPYKCDWCGKRKIVAHTHYGTTEYTRLICEDCAKRILKKEENN